MYEEERKLSGGEFPRRRSRMVKNKAVYVALGVTREGEREVLGLWIADNEGAKFWLSVMNERRNRGIQDILIAVVDGRRASPRRSPRPSRRPPSRPVSFT
jgi:transposase-like protein